ncbi:hypothetical protein NE237_029389 [Protea cynaroides]|uniref:Uncharacterized protein n=1 Tax=Protea cynaroides TaxID=273540 RepID=A0A9Q0GV59_9MAGN|nr:hypothetical protein NE237_029389 [Protea cynaroides]
MTIRTQNKVQCSNSQQEQGFSQGNENLTRLTTHDLKAVIGKHNLPRHPSSDLLSPTSPSSLTIPSASSFKTGVSRIDPSASSGSLPQSKPAEPALIRNLLAQASSNSVPLHSRDIFDAYIYI